MALVKDARETMRCLTIHKKTAAAAYCQSKRTMFSVPKTTPAIMCAWCPCPLSTLKSTVPMTLPQGHAFRACFRAFQMKRLCNSVRLSPSRVDSRANAWEVRVEAIFYLSSPCMSGLWKLRRIGSSRADGRIPAQRVVAMSMRAPSFSGRVIGSKAWAGAEDSPDG